MDMKRTIEMILMTLLIVLVAVFVGSALISCSSDDEDKDIVIDDVAFVIDPDGIIDSQFSEEYHTDLVDGCTITRDETDRIVSLEYYKEGTDPVGRLNNCPSSFDEIKYLFPLSENHEIRLEGTTHLEGPNGEIPECSEIYRLFYKDVLVDRGWAEVFYINTPQGKRMTHAITEAFIDIKDLNTNPVISEQQARQIFANYMKIDRDDSWTCKLCIKEYSTRKEGTIVRKHVLVYDVTGSYPPEAGWCGTGWTIPRAVIDAQTGHIISTNK